MSGVVTDFFIQLLEKQVDDKGLVVWYDPELAYGGTVVDLELSNTTVVRYEGSFLQLRKQIDPLLCEGQPPRLVVYVPMEREKTDCALIELDCAGVVMQPRQQPPACNTRLSVVARNALKPILGEDQVAEIERQIEAGKLTLADLNSLAEQGVDISTGVLKLIFDSANPQEVALAFLHSDQYDDAVGKKEAQKELRQLLQLSFDIELHTADSMTHWRTKLGRHVLLTDLLAVLKKQVPAALASVPVATNAAGIDACVRLARTWRNDREVRDSFVSVSSKVEQELSLDNLSLTGGNNDEDPWQVHEKGSEAVIRSLFSKCETFLAVELELMQGIEKKLTALVSRDFLDLANARLSGFWAAAMPSIQARWALICSAGEVLLQADRVQAALKNFTASHPSSYSVGSQQPGEKKKVDPGQLTRDLVHAYADDEEPWCLLDTHHRHMESRKYNFEFAANSDHLGLEKLIAKAEHRYTTVGSELAKHFITHFQKAKHPIKGLLRQRDVFEKQVKPLLGNGKLAYVWVDALRFEMARELCRLLSDDFELEVQPAIGTMPTITEIGMAALLPKAHESAKVVSVGGGKLALEIDGQVIKDRKDRVAFLKKHAGVSVFDAKLDDLLPKPSKKVRDGIQNNDLILITSQEIDELGESDNMSQARLQIDGVLSHLRRGVRLLADQGVKNIVLVADHGHLFADEIGEDMKIESPGGKVEDLHRRVWVGIGGVSEPSYLRTSLASLGVESEFDIATPWTLAVFKSKGGGRAYFHGGLSPQELIVPVVVLHSTAKPAPPTTSIRWTLTPGTAKLTTRFFSIQIAGSQNRPSLFGFDPPKVRIELRANKKCVSLPVSASYGFEDATGEVKLRIADVDNEQIETNTVTVMLSEEISQKTVAVYLLDANTGVELAAPLTVDVAISF